MRLGKKSNRPIEHGYPDPADLARMREAAQRMVSQPNRALQIYDDSLLPVASSPGSALETEASTASLPENLEGTTEVILARELTEDAQTIFGHQSSPNTPLPKAINEQTALDLFTFRDAIPDAEGEADTPNAQLYAREFVAMYNEVGGERLVGQAESIVQACQEILRAINVQGSPYSESITWVLWDLAKQSYLSATPRTAAAPGTEPVTEHIRSDYQTRTLADGTQVRNDTDPLTDTTKLWNTLDTMLGSELERHLFGSLLQDPQIHDPDYQPDYAHIFSSELSNNGHFAAIEHQLNNGAHNATNVAGANAEVYIPALRSMTTSIIGEQVRLAALEIIDGGISKSGRYHQATVELEREEFYKGFVPDTEFARTTLREKRDKVSSIWGEITASRQQRGQLLTSLYEMTTWNGELTPEQKEMGRQMITIPPFTERKGYETKGMRSSVATTNYNDTLTRMLVLRNGGHIIESHFGDHVHPTSDPFVNLYASFNHFEGDQAVGNRSRSRDLEFHLDRIWN